MRDLKEFLSHSKDFPEGDGSVERVQRYYTQAPEEAERLWRNLIEGSHDEKETRKEFMKLLEEGGQLYIQNDVRNYRNNLTEPRFEMRAYPIGEKKVPVLKVTFPTRKF